MCLGAVWYTNKLRLLQDELEEVRQHVSSYWVNGNLAEIISVNKINPKIANLQLEI